MYIQTQDSHIEFFEVCLQGVYYLLALLLFFAIQKFFRVSSVSPK
jgi:hypothetical protein